MQHCNFIKFMHMNKTYSYELSRLCGLCLVAGSLFCGSISAEAQNQMFVGHANPAEVVYPYTGFSNNSSEGGTLCFAVRLGADKFSNFEGAQLTGIRIGWGSGAEYKTPDMEVFVRESLNGENIVTGTSQVAFGWNDIMFDTPYTIEAGKDLYLGGNVAWDPGSWLATGVYGYNLPEGTQFMGNVDDRGSDGNVNWMDVTDNGMVLLLLGIVNAEGEEFTDKATLVRFRSNEIQSLTSPGDAWLVIKNEGLNEINSVELSASLDDKTWSHTLEFNKAISGGVQNEVTGGIQALGSGVHKIWISKVNDEAIEKPTKLDFNLIGVPDDVAAKYVRRPLVERWSSESEYRTPSYTDDIFLPGVMPVRDKISLLSHHFSDQYMIYHEFDKDVDNEDIKYLVDFAGGDKSRVSTPSFSVDRSFIPRNPIARSGDVSVAYNFVYPEHISDLYKTAIETPTFASVDAKATVSDGKCEIEISGNIEPGIMPDNEPLYLTVCVLEDNVESTSQEFPDDPELIDRYHGVFTHHDLIRLKLTDMYGEKIDVSGSYTKKYSCELEPEWNVDNMRVLAFLNRSGEKHNHMQVINSVEYALGDVGVEGIVVPGEVRIAVSGRDILVSGDCKAQIYTLDGIQVAGTGLCPGIYLVKVNVSEGSFVRKVVVK